MATKTRTKNLPPWLKKGMDEEEQAPKRPAKKGKKPAGKKGC